MTSSRSRSRSPVIAVVAAASTLVLTLAGCSGGGDDPKPAAAQQSSDASGASASEAGGTWTVLHYSVADNNLEPAMAGDVNEIGTVGSTGDLQVREYMDRSPEYGDDPVLDQGSWVGARIFDVGEGGATTLVDDLGDTDSSDPQTLADFVGQGFTDLPADHYALIISDHGGQWNGIGQDETSGGGLLTLPDLVDGISAGLDTAGVDKLDLLGFDACLMAGYEVATAMAPLADRMVASQESEPGHGWDYAALSAAADGASPDDFGSAIIDGFQAQSEEAGDVAGVTLSMIDLTQMGTLDTAIADFSTALQGSAAAPPAVGRAQTEVQGFGKSPDPAQDQHLSDLASLATQVASESPDIAEQADALASAVDTVVLDSFAGEALPGSTGLSIYLPPSVDFYSLDYEAVSSTPWVGFLDGYYGLGDAIPAAAAATWTQYVPDFTYDADGVTLSATYDPASQDNLTEATISYAVYENDGTVTYLGEEAADLGTVDDPTAVGTFDFTTLEMSDGEDTVSAYTDLDVDLDAGLVTISVPLLYYPVDSNQGQDVVLTLVLDSETGDYISDTYYQSDPETGLLGEAQLDPEGLIAPELPNYDADGVETWYASSDIGLYADLANITYDFVPLDSGTELQMDLGLYDFGGGVDYSTTTDVVVP